MPDYDRNLWAEDKKRALEEWGRCNDYWKNIYREGAENTNKQMICVSWEDLEKAALECDEFTSALFDFDEEEHYPPDSDLSPAAKRFTLMPDDPMSLLERNAILMWGPTHVTYNPFYLGEARFLAKLVQESYESSILTEEISHHIWRELLMLGGDDTVDYCGTHIDGLLDVIEAYEEWRKCDAE